MKPEIEASEFNPTPTSEGFAMWEHWETVSGGRKALLSVSSTSFDMVLKPGDFILQRFWAPASTPIVYNHARKDGAR